MKIKKLSFYLIFIVILFGSAELSCRLFLCFTGYSFFEPSEYIFSAFYKNLKQPAGTKEGLKAKVTRILILGGSVVSPGYSDLHNRMDTILVKRYGNVRNFEVVNVAAPAHTSLDNFLKYKLLENQRFDLVIYYEGINDTRVNNIPPGDFKEDYSHVKWYADINRLLRHTEIDITVIPYLLDMVVNAIYDRLTGKTYLEPIGVEPGFVKFGRQLKTKSTYRRNIEGIAEIAGERGDKLMLLSYASCFPDEPSLEEKNNNSQYAACMFATPTSMWGESASVKAGIQAHNQIIRNVAEKYRTVFLDMEHQMPKDPKLFCDVCHVSEPGAQRFAHEIVEFIVRRKILE